MYYNKIDTTIGCIAEDMPEIISSIPYVLIRMIDSSEEVESVIKYHNKIYNMKYIQIAKGVIMSGKDIIELHEKEKLFTGFDEIWCFLSMPNIYPKKYLVSPNEINKCFSAEYEAWMDISGCMLGLGDGAELNYITTQMGIAQKLESLALGN